MPSLIAHFRILFGRALCDRENYSITSRRRPGLDPGTKLRRKSYPDSRTYTYNPRYKLRYEKLGVPYIRLCARACVCVLALFYACVRVCVRVERERVYMCVCVSSYGSGEHFSALCPTGVYYK